MVVFSRRPGRLQHSFAALAASQAAGTSMLGLKSLQTQNFLQQKGPTTTGTAQTNPPWHGVSELASQSSAESHSAVHMSGDAPAT